MTSACGAAMRKASTSARPSLRQREGANVRCSAKPATTSRAGRCMGGEPSQVSPLCMLALRGTALITPISTFSGIVVPSGT